MPRHQPYEFPNGKRFAFTVVDDTDVGTVDNLKPLYELLYELGLRTTKTVWPVACPEGSENFGSSETLDDEAYRAFVLDLQSKGFEVTWHAATMESSDRARTVAALARYREIFHADPRIHVNHSHNRENVYWGAGRFDSPIVRFLFAHAAGRPAEYFTGHVEGSRYWWGDLCAKYMEYGRNLTTNDINTAAFNPSMPYRDPARPLVHWWFSSSDADDVADFNALIHPSNQDRLEREGGFCIVATHFGKDFVRDGRVNPITRERLTELSRRPGWFPTTGELLDWLRARREANGDGGVPPIEWRRMQWRFVVDLAARKLRPRRTILPAWAIQS